MVMVLLVMGMDALPIVAGTACRGRSVPLIARMAEFATDGAPVPAQVGALFVLD
jgi:hypothetical protein